MSWNESYRLSWADFKGKPNNNVSAVAITASGITFGFSITQTDSGKVVKFSTEVNAHFYPDQSWYKKELADNHVLGHEQLHFDITELYTRKFRQRISQLRTSNSIRQELKTLHNNIIKELETAQNTYDNETDYSRNYEAQAIWKSYIEAELKKVSRFKSRESE
ncbi:DUF922 domain-containing protein [Sabulilitoribacter multivorans]|uniref:DUF922 domain-containing protein n=1 Tax=Flaviramulus multivorans TaxID=1304750 RepID=A0ABS9IHJ4_9FLAO|nr:DUF922 domain-containing protein [Flaviramulus multivorans]MCF7560231.1 DUF922 domain-containing protein [Flaviramulus multivorans]